MLASHSCGSKKQCHLSTFLLVAGSLIGILVQYKDGHLLGWEVCFLALLIVLAALCVFPFLPVNFAPCAPAFFAFSMLTLATHAGTSFLVDKFKLKSFQSSESELSPLFLLEEVPGPLNAFSRQANKSKQERSQWKTFIATEPEMAAVWECCLCNLFQNERQHLQLASQQI